MGDSLSSPFRLRKSILQIIFRTQMKTLFHTPQAGSDLGNPACRSADRAKTFHREQTERHQDGDQKMTTAFLFTCQHTKTNMRVSQHHHFARWTRNFSSTSRRRNNTIQARSTSFHQYSCIKSNVIVMSSILFVFQVSHYKREKPSTTTRITLIDTLILINKELSTFTLTVTRCIGHHL
jgi:hypothetical protein